METAKESDRNSALATVLAELEADRAAIDAAIAVIKRKMSTESAGHEVIASSIQVGNVVLQDGDLIRSDAFFNMSIKAATRKYLSIMKRKQPTKGICAALERGGLHSTAKSFVTTVYSVLARDDDFVRVGGEWGLSEWYPGRTKKVKSQAIPNGKDGPENEPTSGKI